MDTKELLGLVDQWIEHAERAYSGLDAIDAAAELSTRALGVLRATRSQLQACVANGREVTSIHIEVKVEASEPQPDAPGATGEFA